MNVLSLLFFITLSHSKPNTLTPEQSSSVSRLTGKLNALGKLNAFSFKSQQIKKTIPPPWKPIWDTHNDYLYIAQDIPRRCKVDKVNTKTFICTQVVGFKQQMQIKVTTSHERYPVSSLETYEICDIKFKRMGNELWYNTHQAGYGICSANGRYPSQGKGKVEKIEVLWGNSAK